MVNLTTPKKILDWVHGDEGTFTSIRKTVTNNILTMKTVASGKILYVTSISLSYANSGAATATVTELQFEDVAVLALSTSAVDGEHDSISLSFTIPVKLIATETIKLDSNSANQTCTGTFTGYIIDA